ncbi:Serine/threonine protein kinase [Modestobacter italicus]|uniref:mitogen-activated protein kinase kinase n=1 Tax=Modestobacter italicus (strain DSM 44449 / CECT 9708 / BC 501) TaxID=2732864 RepID=I4EQY8_MODI5|nr:serine/threonine-protein kinase [Modestobacter marinus]CCH85801.1 Serine/threonine protein kinase [Modestobacter marinus]
MSTAEEVPGLLVPPDLEVALLLQTVWDMLAMGGHWPTYERVDRVLFHQHHLDIATVMSRTSTELLRGGRPEGGAPPRDDGELTLTLAGAASCSGSGPAIDVVVAAARLAAAAERDLDPAEADPLLTFADVARELGIDPSRARDVARRSGLLLVSEPWTGSNSLSEDSWQLRVDRRARPYAGVHDLAEYWGRRKERAPASRDTRQAAPAENIIQLNRRWRLGEQLGEGGFGKVFVAVGDDGTAVAVKFVPKEPGAERELLFARQEGFRNVVPVLDDGELGDDYVLVMPMADATLRERLFAAGGGLSVGEALAVLIDVVTALTDLEGQVVHRDIKPENVMLLDGTWCLADFGISRYSDASTATHTRMFSLSKEYAAPEQWRLDRATSAADVYAVGVMAFELLAGHRPFPGPGLHDFQEQHLTQAPPHLGGVSPQLDAIVQDCLAKQPKARPTPVSLLQRLEHAATPKTAPGFSALVDAYRQHCEREVAAAAVVTAQDITNMTKQKRRPGLAAAASRTWARVSTTLLSTVLEAAPGVAVYHLDDGGWLVILDGAALELSTAWPVPDLAPRWPFDVIAHATVKVVVHPTHADWEGRSHSLWYCDAQREGQYGWFETAFMSQHGGGPQEPFALWPEKAEGALSDVLASTQVAWPFTELVPGETDEFGDRWIGWFGAAVKGKLFRPSFIPESDPAGSWRRA